jgi:hypothetical protein
MDELALTAATIAAKWAAESFVKEGAKSAFAALKPVYDWVKAKLTGDPPAAAALNDLTGQQDKPEAVTEIARAISAQLASDGAAKEELGRLVAKARQDGVAGAFVVQVMEGAKVGKIVSIGTIVGDVNF